MNMTVPGPNNTPHSARKVPTKSSLGWIFQQIIMIVVGVLVLYPLFFVLMTSFKTNSEVIIHPFKITSFHPENYTTAWKLGHVGQYFLNSAIVTTVTIVLQIVIILLAGYALGKLRPKGSNIILTLYLTALFVTTEMTTVPIFVFLRNLGLINTRWALVLPYTASGLVLGIYIVTNFIKGLPKEIEEAAFADGAGLSDMIFKIDLPLITPVIATVVIINFQGVWSEFYWALISIKDESLKTLPLGLINFQSEYGSNYGVLSAGLAILTAPILLVYLFCSRFFIEGISLGAVKG